MANTRRQAILRVTPALLGEFFFSGEIHCLITSGLPEDAKFVGAWFDHTRSVFDLVYESEKFNLVEEGQECPLLEPPVVEKIKEKT